MRNNNKNSKQNAFHIKSGSFKDEFPVRISDTCETRLSTYYLLIESIRDDTIFYAMFTPEGSQEGIEY